MRAVRSILLAAWLLSPAAFAQVAAPAEPLISYESIFHPVAGTRGMVSSQEARATRIGVGVLERGGNAIDAAVAVAYALAVTLPKAGNLGGGGFMLIHSAEDGKCYAIDFREVAPKASHPDLFLDEDGEVDEELARFSPRSVGVPGTVRGLSLARREFGTRPLAQLIAPALELAREGFPVSRSLANDLVLYREKLNRSEAIREIFYKSDGAPFAPGERLVQKDLAWSLEQIAEHGESAFYEGAIAERLVSFMEKSGGIMTAEDLLGYRAVRRQPVTGTYRGFEIVSMPPPSSGGVHLIQMLNILEKAPLRESGHNSAASIHLMAESMKRAYADRSKHLGDPDFFPVPIRFLCSKEYGADLFEAIDLEAATPSEEVLPGEPREPEGEQTTHFSVMDRLGNAVAVTYTLNFSFGSLQMAPGTGILLNNEMDDFSAKAGVPNAFGLIGGEANAIGPRKRPLSSMTPTIVRRDGKPYLVTGSPGGSKIITTVLQTVLNVLEFDMNIAEATCAPRVHHQWLPDELRVEPGISVDTRRLLEGRGHRVEAIRPMGSTQSIVFRKGRFEGFSDPRRPDALTLGY